MKGLSKRQQQVFNFIDSYKKENSISPSIADIADGLGLSNSTINSYLKALKKKGALTWREFIPRSFRILKHTTGEPA